MKSKVNSDKLLTRNNVLAGIGISMLIFLVFGVAMGAVVEFMIFATVIGLTEAIGVGAAHIYHTRIKDTKDEYDELDYVARKEAYKELMEEDGRQLEKEMDY